jgi:hypothetical protein
MKPSDHHKWYHYPAAHVAFFFLLLGLGAGIGIRVGSPIAGLATGAVAGIIASLIASHAWEAYQPMPPSEESKKDILERLAIYTDGKMKRYSLFFGVNGGAFAIAQLMADKSKDMPGVLTLPSLAIGAIMFTIVMTTDIWLWGQSMRRKEFAGELAFTPFGKAILLLIAGLIVSGWVLVALPTKP